ncbi:hypothetical protein DFS34DRAFT_650261 [Phlyctochytrium arcticum]|nr:hypothetical protein DFS34DRAFT_650261 [Phlyctochytrium arcticum]
MLALDTDFLDSESFVSSSTATATHTAAKNFLSKSRQGLTPHIFSVVDSDDDDDEGNHIKEERNHQLKRLNPKSKHAWDLGPPKDREVSSSDHDVRKKRRKKQVAETISKERQRFHAVERDLDQILARPGISSLLSAAADDDNDAIDPILQVEFGVEQKALRRKLSGVQKMVVKLWEHVRRPDSGPEDIGMLKFLMETIEADILVYRTSHQETSVSLLALERRLEHEMTVAHDHYSVLENNVSGTQHDPTVTMKSVRFRQQVEPGGLLSEVVTYQNFVAKHGMTGGWDEMLHARFVKLWSKYRKDKKMLIQHCLSIPDTTHDTAVAHIKWYERFEALSQEKKDAIKSWRLQRQGHGDDHEGDGGQGDEEADTGMDGTRMDSEGKATRKEEEMEEERKRVKEEIAQWKADREVKAQTAKAAQEAAIQAREQHTHSAQARRQQLQRERVEAYIQQRAQEQARQKRVQEEEERARRKGQRELEAVEGERLAKKTEALLQRKQDQKATRIKQDLEKERRLDKLRQQVAPAVSRDPSRVLAPTTAYTKKLETKEDQAVKEAARFFKASALPKRTIPMWRKGI